MTPDEFAAELRVASRQVRRLPSALRRGLSAEVQDAVASPLADRIRSRVSGPWASVLAPAIRSRRGTDVTINVGGARRALSGGGSVRQVVYGAEFGGGSRTTVVQGTARQATHVRHTTRQFLDNHHPFIYSTIGDSVGWILDQWSDAVSRTLTEEGPLTDGR